MTTLTKEAITWFDSLPSDQRINVIVNTLRSELADAVMELYQNHIDMKNECDLNAFESITYEA